MSGVSFSWTTLDEGGIKYSPISEHTPHGCDLQTLGPDTHSVMPEMTLEKPIEATMTTETSEAFIYVAMSRLMGRRLARS